MAVDVFLKIDGIAGESADSQFKDWVEVLSLNWTIERTTHLPGKDNITSSQFSIIKAVDKATPLIIQAMIKHENINKIEIVLCRAGQEKVKYLGYVFENCVITKVEVQMANNSGQSLPTENVEFRFASVEITYFQQKRATGGSAGHIVSQWKVSERG